LKAKADEVCILDYSMSFNVVELHRKLLREAAEGLGQLPTGTCESPVPGQVLHGIVGV